MKRHSIGLSLVIAFIALGGIAPGHGELLGRQPHPLVVAMAPSPAKVDDGPQLDVHYDPSPYPVVNAMLSIARVNKDDVLFDLGSGDGRIVITAAKNLGVRGTGVDLDPQRIKESRESARKAGVESMVAFIQGNLFDVDLSSATVVTLFLYDDVNIRVRPKLLRELKPGTRVVSHEHDMDDWKPDQKTKAECHTVYYWVIPANVGGTWHWRNDQSQYTLELKQKFQKIKGTLASGAERVVIRDVQLKGDELSFTIKERVQGFKTPARFSGKVNGNQITGTVESGAGENLSWKPQRDQSTVAPLDKLKASRASLN